MCVYIDHHIHFVGSIGSRKKKKLKESEARIDFDPIRSFFENIKMLFLELSKKISFVSVHLFY